MADDPLAKLRTDDIFRILLNHVLRTGVTGAGMGVGIGVASVVGSSDSGTSLGGFNGEGWAF